MSFPREKLISFKPPSLEKLFLTYTPKHAQLFTAESIMPDSHALWKPKVVQILQTYVVFKRNIIKSSMFEAPLILALGTYTSNPCKSSCTFQSFFTASLFTYPNIWLLPVNPSDITYQIPTRFIFKRFPKTFMSVNHSLSSRKDIPYQFLKAVENALVAFPSVSKLKKWNVTLQKNS